MVLLQDMFGVIAFSIAVCCLIEAAQYLIIYRKPKFRQFKERIAAQNKKLGELQTVGGGVGGKKSSKGKKQERLENSMKMETGRMFSTMKLQQTIITMGTMLAAYRVLSKLYDGKIVAKLPFEPWPLFRRITHRGLEGNDPTDAAMTLIFSLVQMGFRQNLSTWLGLGPSRQMQGLMAKNHEMVQQQVCCHQQHAQVYPLR